MLKYILKRVILMIPIILCVSFIVFFILNLTPGDPATNLLGVGASAEDIYELNEELGYNKPFLERFFIYIKDIVTKFDFGTSYRTQQDVRTEIIKRIPVSFKVVGLAMLFGSTIGISLGVLAAVKQYSFLDTTSTIFCMLLSAMPSFWIGMLILYAFSLKLGWFPAFGIGSFKHYILPMVALGLPLAAVIMRYTRSSILDTIRSDYVRTAKAKGASERKVIWKHAFGNALMPIITVIGLNFASLIGGSVATETLFSLPGIGYMLVDSIRKKDIPLVMGCTIFLAATCSVVVLIIDIIYAFIDPRIKAKYKKRK